MKKKIPLIRPKIDEKFVGLALKDIAKTGMLTKGKYLAAFEKKFSNILEKKYVYGVTSCTTALHLALVAGGVKAGDEVLVSDFRFPATGNVVVHIGAEPDFVDVDLKTFCMDPADLEKKDHQEIKGDYGGSRFWLSGANGQNRKDCQKTQVITNRRAASAMG